MTDRNRMPGFFKAIFFAVIGATAWFSAQVTATTSPATSMADTNNEMPIVIASIVTD